MKSKRWKCSSITFGSLALNILLFTLLRLEYVDNNMARHSLGASSCYQEPFQPSVATTPSTPPTDDDLHSCRAQMQSNAKLRDGGFLTGKAAGYEWIRRSDDSRELRLAQCQLHRYTADEARQCLANRHVMFIGDSLTRYQYLSLAYFLHRGVYPPRFGLAKNGNCTHIDATGQPTCATEPNVVMEGDFIGASPDPMMRDPWEWYHAAVGGWTDGGIFDGHLECNCARGNSAKCGDGLPPGDCNVENMLYFGGAENNNIVLSNIQETGWFAVPRPILGFNFTQCGKTGTCRRTAAAIQTALRRAYVERNYDFNQSVPDALEAGGVFRQQLPEIDIALYNRGLWNSLPVEGAKHLFPILRKASRGKCLYKTTTGCQRSPPKLKHETENLKDIALDSGCGFYDVGLLTSEFSSLEQSQPDYLNVFWDAVHYRPWVYEELNNILLNILCNADPLDSTATTHQT